MALQSNYSASSYFDEHPSLMFVTAVVNRNENFAETIQRYGHTRSFNSNASSKRPASPTGTGVFGIKDGNYSKEQNIEPEDEHNPYALKLRCTTDQPELSEVITGEAVMQDQIGSDILEWLSDLYKSSRGFELGTFDKNLLSRSMKVQAAKWGPLSHGYILDIIHLAHSFVNDLLRLICPDERAREGLMSVLMDPLLLRYRKALENARFLVEVERTNPQTANHYFNDNLEKW